MSEQETEPQWPRWHVKTGKPPIIAKTNLVGEATHTLCYLGKAVNRAKGISGLNAMMRQRDFMNERRLEPKDAVECLADLGRAARESEAASWDLILKEGN